MFLISFLDSPNALIGSNVVKYVAVVREAATQFDTDEWIGQLEHLLAHSKNFAYCISFGEDSKASAEYVLQRAAETVWNSVRRINKTVPNTPQFSFLPKVSSLSFSILRTVYSRIKTWIAQRPQTCDICRMPCCLRMGVFLL